MVHAIEMDLAGRRLRLETGRVAKQADGAVLATYGDTVVLATAVGSQTVRPGIDFLPLTVDYQEKAYAAGKIPGGYFKREGRPSEKEVLTSRLIDRPMRPLFPEGYYYETQVIASVLSADQTGSSDVVGITAASAALTLSDIPFGGPVAGIRIGRVNGQFVVNPDIATLEANDLHLVVAGTGDAVMMVEGGGNELPESVMIDAIEVAHAEIKKIVGKILELQAQAGRPKRTVVAEKIAPALSDAVRQLVAGPIRDAILIPNKTARQERLGQNLVDAIAKMKADDPDRSLQIQLAVSALRPVIPSKESFPYTLRLVSDILESNGSSSMATVCGGALALMDAGVPIKEPVAGIAMGLIKEGERVMVLSDILGLEDHLGDMDFKVTGTKHGVTALQMDIKIAGITPKLMRQALDQARKGRLYILERMAEALPRARPNLSPFAPRIFMLKIKQDRIRDVIGPGGKMIPSIISDCGVKINVEETGDISIAAVDEASAKKAIEMINRLTEEVEVGKIYLGTVRKIMHFGAFVEILPGTDGLVHISQLAHHRVKSVSDEVKEGDQVMVKVLEIDKQGKIRLSRKEAMAPPSASSPKEPATGYPPGGGGRSCTGSSCWTMAGGGSSSGC